MNEATPSMAAYMAKLEGRYAAAAWKLPALKMVATKNAIPIRGFSVAAIAFQSSVWHSAHANAST
jgi:hypothetical protein